MENYSFKVKPMVEYYDTFQGWLADQLNLDGSLILTIRPLKELLEGSLQDSSVTIVLYESYFAGEPDTKGLNKLTAMLAELSKGQEITKIIGIGGGSVLDCCKLLTDREISLKLKDIFSTKGEKFHKERELILLPTTCGTGSEMTNISIFYNNELETKQGLAFDSLFADKAVLIPELLENLPLKPLLLSAIDSLIHAIEAYLSPKANNFTQTLSSQAIRSILQQFSIIANKLTLFEEINIINDENIIKSLMEASAMSGVAFGNAGVGAVHAISYPLGGKYHVAHGEANYLFLCEVLRVYFIKKMDSKGETLLIHLKSVLAGEETTAEEIIGSLEKLLDKLCEKKGLAGYGMKANECQLFARSVVENQQRLLANNYAEISEQEIESIYRKLL